ncbi:MAG: TAXI family TRAP transporter solute-binding subunit [Devosia sp.]|jgi:TRAP transporter TAXI family solute receptor|uniref:TAXI family TRAP transporter solute-binding subunit n=1 Tax=unclassified Devosia TaxID=196773 RepID=UPI001A082B07|nr:MULTISPECIES: TAXI family TRAP transporter solute-binding subunit [unclassified Devosia]MBF0680136.1 TAXI family TRAP transporter solute-binding subunit [Devosia sp.]WEJ34990.1 TAXI family TRAP transporter solute-binding subunit [Devosia sp. SD17-2]
MTVLSPRLLSGVLATTLVFSAGAVPAQSQEFINVLTGGTSGVYYPLGVALSELYAENIEGARTQVQATKASVENLNLLQQGKGELAFALGDSVKAGWDGVEEAGFPQPLTEIRAIAAIYSNYVQIVANAESGIKSLEDLRGKSISVGAPASGTELNARAIFAAAGMSYDDMGKVEYLPYAESAELIKNRQLDATLQSSGLGVAFIQDLAATMPINIVAIPAEVVDTIGAPYIASVIPAGTYDGQTEDVSTAAIGNILVTHAGVSDETAYQMTKLMFENLDRMVASHSAAADIDPANALTGLSIPLHPGAERYYREAGLL